ncbi:MAG TPA: beta-propeller fold lactonase family protein [Kofleriaceae bacterium]|jgi:DNA-binding beta-propeller fold protein YncE|nr:beta-propeller fold lactonase family protein [Kofleriaceae bacterium]
MRPLISFVTLGVTATLSCTPAPESSRSDESTDPDVGVTPHHQTTGTGSPFTLFESGQVRPLALSPDKQHLFAVNTPDNRLEIFRIKPNRLIHTASIPVGLEPVAVAARTDHEVWVVNHLSDSVSVVELDDDAAGHVERTLLVGDEPRDIVFAGPGRRRAFITTAHRGQNIPFDPQLTTPGVGRADVWVFDANALGNTLGGSPLTIVTLFTDTPRALAVTPDGSRVYAAGFHTGNRTATVGEFAIPNGFGPGGVVGPATNFEGKPAPEVGAILEWNGFHWVDSAGFAHDDVVKFSLPDKDVFVLDAMANPPHQLSDASGFFQGVGTILYTMAVNPVNGKIYVANTDANNLDLFEGPGIFAGHSLRGHLHESRITVLTPGGGVAPRHLNKHINYHSCCAPIPNAENAKSLALPQSMAVTGNGAILYVAALGSDKVGVLSTAQLENNTFVPNAANHIHVSGGGPTGLVLDEDRAQLYVLTRFDNAISIIDTTTKAETQHVAMHNPEPASVVVGRRFLYDASSSSSHGDSSCASCHVFGDFDSLAWNLGNPDAKQIVDPGPFASALLNLLTGQLIDPVFHPMKGPMMTQSLRGMANHGPMHWRGDRTGGNDAPSIQPDSGSFDEHAAFLKFRVGFIDLLGRDTFIPEANLEAFANFILQITYPPNPNRPLSNVLTADQDVGRQLFNETNCGIPACLDGNCPILACASCHTVDPDGKFGNGFFGTSGFSEFAFQTQLFKTPQLRNLYQKIGAFGHPLDLGFPGTETGFQGDQVRGFGFVHDGNMDTIFRFHHGPSFSEEVTGVGNGGLHAGPEGEIQRRQLETFLFAFPTNLAPIVGQQITLTASSSSAVVSRIELLRQRADAGECDLVAKTELLGVEAGFWYVGSGLFRSDHHALPPITDAALQLLATHSGHPVTYTCTPPGSGERIGVDRDGDGFWDGDERDAHSDPADPTSTP